MVTASLTASPGGGRANCYKWMFGHMTSPMRISIFDFSLVAGMIKRKIMVMRGRRFFIEWSIRGYTHVYGRVMTCLRVVGRVFTLGYHSLRGWSCDKKLSVATASGLSEERNSWSSFSYSLL
ncbi:hypothetical protein CEXT_812161 [Caerostris extrusa]|uniref:Uncharacterized protein n=1 Tax=Caerostris extrusa TaxID=172846 RepID=A0AAV4TH81_CAEEX|nr:hypothetical protein CEXT_812161 [Caerostris extrusa]